MSRKPSLLYIIPSSPYPQAMPHFMTKNRRLPGPSPDNSASRLPRFRQTALVLACLGWFLPFLMGCSESSEWDHQWEQAQNAFNQQDYQTAKAHLRELRVQVRADNPGGIREAKIVFQFGEIARLEGQTEQAESFYWETLPLVAQSVGPEHHEMTRPLLALSALYQEKGQTKLALPLQKRALALQEKALGKTAPQLLPTLQRYHDLLRAMNMNDKAEEINGRIRHLLTLPP